MDLTADRPPAEPALRSIVLLAGLPGSGKTAACLEVVEGGRARGLTVAGVLSPARFGAAGRNGIDVVDIASGRRRRLATIDERRGSIRAGAYRFSGAALAWGAACLAAATPCDILVVDELGPLEVERGEGWANAFDVLAAGRYGLALVSVRPSLVQDVARRLRTAAPAGERAPIVRVLEPKPDSARYLLALASRP